MADQLQREIEEILDRLDDFIPEEKSRSGLRTRVGSAVHAFMARLGALLTHASLGYLLVISLILVFMAFVFRSSPIGQYAMIAGLALLGLTIGLSFVIHRRRPDKRWRGQVVDLSGPSFVDKLQGWFKKHSHTR